jgi:hypothetical protein
MSRHENEYDDDHGYEYDDDHGYEYDDDHGYEYLAGSEHDNGRDDGRHDYDQYNSSGLVSQSGAAKGYLFDIQNGVVTGVSEYEHGFVETESIDRNETYSFDGSVVTKIETERYGVETSTYADSNGDGIYEKVSHAWTPTSTAAPAGRSYDDWYEYGGSSDDYELHHTGQAVVVTDVNSGKTLDSLQTVSRVLFTDAKIAYDLDGHAGDVAKLLGAVFGAEAVSNREYAGIGIQMLDGGVGYEDLAGLALEAAGASTNQEVCTLLWTNLFGEAPTDSDIEPYENMLNSGQLTRSQLVTLAADTDHNLTNIDFVGLSQTGLEYL